MPVQTSAPSVPDSFPSFMSVVGGKSSTPDARNGDAISCHRAANQMLVNTSRRLFPFQHRESVSSAASESTESSPTTTVSTCDSTSVPDITPSSSPESPSSMTPFYSKLGTPASRDPECQSATNAFPKLPHDPSKTVRPASPGRRARNLKNLSLRMPAPSPSRPPIATASVMEGVSERHFSAPPSPIHIPPKSVRRRPANLTIQTPALDKSFPSDLVDIVPPTPQEGQFLRHTESTPSLTSIFSPSSAPDGGVKLSRPKTNYVVRRLSDTSEHNFSIIRSMEERGRGTALHDLEEEDDHPPHSRESTMKNERGYPDGPIRMYDSELYLYLEPTIQEASQFDVVINVAKEVANPFVNNSVKNDTELATWRSKSTESKRFSNGHPQTAISKVSFKSAFEYIPTEVEDFETPRKGRPYPEYIHVNWDHNSEILDDLYPLCELIDCRINQGKRILIHCQLGVSRSASLVIGYGLYKNRDLDFNAVYGMVKERSRWVGPNMSLIYQLTEFRSRFLRGARLSSGLADSFNSTSNELPKIRPSSVIHSKLDTYPELRRDHYKNNNEEDSMTNLSQESSLASLVVRSTCNYKPTPNTDASLFMQRRSLTHRPLPLRQSFDFRGRPFGSFNADHDVGHDSIIGSSEWDDSPSFTLLSPRTTSFLPPLCGHVLDTGKACRNSLDLSLKAADPRSPAQGSQPLITRNIDEFL